jgi:hypothetical protein
MFRPVWRPEGRCLPVRGREVIFEPIRPLDRIAAMHR